jgi:5-methylcytosine-specific restriction endonuclease McrA
MAWTLKQRREYDVMLKRTLTSQPAPPLSNFKPANKNRLRKGMLLATYGPHCAYCGRTLTPKSVTRDHVLPKVQGGTNAGNILPACLICNRLKGPLTLEQFKEVARTAWESRRTIESGSSWRHLFSRFGQVGVRFYCEKQIAKAVRP